MSQFHCKHCGRAIFDKKHIIEKRTLWDLSEYQADAYLVEKIIEMDSLHRYDCSLHQGWYCCRFIAMRMVEDKFETGDDLVVYADSVVEVADGASAPTVAKRSSVMRLTLRDFDHVMQSGAQPEHIEQLMVVKLGAIWCPPCRLMDAVFDRIHESGCLDNVRFFEIDVDEEPVLAARWNPRSIPFFVFYQGGAPVNLMRKGIQSTHNGLVGGFSQGQFEQICRSLLA